MKDIKEITKKLEDGVKAVFEDGAYQNYLTTMARFHNYSFYNTMLIHSQRNDASLVAGFKTWEKQKRHVKKGEKAIWILAPVPKKYTKTVTHEDGTEEEKEITWTGFRAVPVFDVAQTDGEELPSTNEFCKVLTGTVAEYEKLRDTLISVAPCKVAFEEIDGTANGFFDGNKIVVKKDMSEAQTVKTLIHEIAHSMLHGKDMDGKNDSRQDKEVQAESVAYIVTSALGIDTSDYSFGYVAGWSATQDLKTLNKNMETIRKTAKEIIDKVA